MSIDKVQTLRRRMPPIVVSGGLFNLKQFKSPAYSIYTASGLVAWLGLYTGQWIHAPPFLEGPKRLRTLTTPTVLTFIDVSAPSQGVSGRLSSYLVAIANGGSAVGRLSGGIIADHIGKCVTPSNSTLPLPPKNVLRTITTGPMNVMTPSLFIAGILTFLWPHVHGTNALVALALLYGASIGAFATLIGAPMIALGNSADVGRRMGMYLTILSFGSLAGPPISGAINRATGGYSVVGIYAGLFSVLCW